MADLMERAACLRASIRVATEALEGKHQDGKLATQLREHLAQLQKMEREMLAAHAGVTAAPALAEPVAWMHEFTDPHSGNRYREPRLHKPADFERQPGDTVRPLAYADGVDSVDGGQQK